jgi:ribA/ribD-fused uncharacterized protein
VDARPRNVGELRQRVGAGWRPQFVFFWSHQPRRGRPDVGSECFSQWYPSPFSVEGHRFAAAEHYMMWSKARLFGDDDSAAAILAAKSPADAKRLGRAVRNFREPVWEQHRLDIVVRANLAKFGENAALRAYLLATGERVLVEASPVDRVWGIGLAAGDQHAENPLRWRGLNLLGFALMDVRERLTLTPPRREPATGT